MRTLALGAVAALVLHTASALAAEAPRPPAQSWSFNGIFGTFERDSLKRGLQVYGSVCKSCHGLEFVAYRSLRDIGLSEDEVKDFAAQHEVEDGPNDEGDMFTRPALPSDRFVKPFRNPQAARAANNGANPPDLSLITKARKGGPDYLYSLLTGYQEPPPPGVTLGAGMHYNTYFPGQQIAMAPPLVEGGVDFADGTPATIQQMAKDVTVFLSWAAEPEMEARKRLGIKTILFLIVLTGILYALKREIWSKLH